MLIPMNSVYFQCSPMHHNEPNYGSLGPEVENVSKATFVSSAVINVMLLSLNLN